MKSDENRLSDLFCRIKMTDEKKLKRRKGREQVLLETGKKTI